MHSKRPRSILSSIFASKRIAVALCAAIAMVLGAMSVGASMGHPPENPDNPIVSAQSGDVISSSNFATNPALPKTLTNASTNVPSQQSTLVPILIAEPSAANTKQPKGKSKSKSPRLSETNIKLNVKTPLGPISINAKPQGASIQLDTPVTDPLNIIVTTPSNPADNNNSPSSNNNEVPTAPDPSNAADDQPVEPQQQPLISVGGNSENVAQN